MKKIFFSLIIFAAVITAAAQDEEQLHIGGDLLTDLRFLTDNGDWIWNENRLNLEFEKNISDNAHFYSSIWIRNFGLPKYNSVTTLYSPQGIQSINLQLREAYVDIFGLANNFIDLRFGKQIINWGTADKINPSNNLNPYDFEDVFDFGRKKGVFALKADMYFSQNFSAQAVYIPFFEPATLPYGIFSQVMQTNNTFTGQNTNYSDTLILPAYNIKNFTAGIKLKTFALNTDFSLGYVYGYDDLPLPISANITALASDMFDMKMKYDFYRRHIFSFDFETSIKSVGLRGEAAIFVPEKEQKLQTTLTFPAIMPDGSITTITQTTDSTVLDKKPYAKFVLGADYSFGSGFYINSQYIHGFLHERGTELNDYLILRFEKSLFYEKLKIAPVSGMISITDWENPQENYAIAYFPQIIFKPTINTDITLSGAFFDGKGQSWFINLKDFNMLMISFKYEF